MRHWQRVIITVALGLSACSKPEPVQEHPYSQGAESLKPVATISGDIVTRAEVDHALAFYSANPFAASDEGKEKVLNEMIDDQVMVKKAIENGFDKSPEFIINQRKLLAHEYRKYLNKKVGETATITDYDVGKYYQDNADKFTKPAMYRVAIYFERKNEKADRKREFSLKQIAEAATFLEAAEGFGKYALASDHLKTNNRGGKLPWVTNASAIAGIPQHIIQQGESLEVGDVSSAIKTEKGVYLVRLIAKKAVDVTSLEAVKADIRKSLLLEKKKNQLANYLQQARDAYDIVTHEENLYAKGSTNDKHSFGPPGFPVQ